MRKERKITLWLSDEQILSELGARLQTARIRAGVTQAQLAQNSGVGKSTIERAERGEGLQLLNLIKIFRALNMIPSLETLLPSSEPSPMEYLTIKNSDSLPQRVRSKRNPNVQLEIKHNFKWGEDE